MDNPAGQPRFTFGTTGLLGGISLIPMMVGMFAVSEVLRHMVSKEAKAQIAVTHIGPIFANMWKLTKQYPWQLIRGSALGTVIGIQPGSGADMAAWMSYAMSKRFSKEPEKFGTGHPEGLIEAGASNNSSLAGAWIPALVFGIPGDSITAIAIGVLYMKNMAPGPTIFVNNPQNVYALFLVFVLANLLMLPLGWAMIKVATRILRVPRDILMPIILLFAIVGAFAINNSLFDVGLMLGFGVLAFLMEENGFPVAPTILGVVLGPLLGGELHQFDDQGRRQSDRARRSPDRSGAGCDHHRDGGLDHLGGAEAEVRPHNSISAGEDPMYQAMKGSTHVLAPTEIAVPAIPEDERVWVPQAPNVWFRPLMLNTLQGQWCNLLRVRRAGILSRHLHPSPVHGFVIKGSWRYLEHDWVATEGSYVFEPPGEIHTLVVPDDVPEMITFFNISGCMYYVDQDNKHVGFEDVFTKIDMCRKHYTEVGLGADYVDQFVR